MSAEATATIPLQTYTERFPHLGFTEPGPGVLEIVISNPARLNAADAHMHRDLALVWREIDLDDSVGAVLVRGDAEAGVAIDDLDVATGYRDIRE